MDFIIILFFISISIVELNQIINFECIMFYFVDCLNIESIFLCIRKLNSIRFIKLIKVKQTSVIFLLEPTVIYKTIII